MSWSFHGEQYCQCSWLLIKKVGKCHQTDTDYPAGESKSAVWPKIATVVFDGMLNRVYSVTKLTELGQSTCVISQLYLLSNSQKSKFGLDEADMTGDQRAASQSRSLATSISFATEMHVRIVNSPSYSPKCSYTEALKKHFSVSRILSVGDIFAVRSSGDSPCNLPLQSLPLHGWLFCQLLRPFSGILWRRRGKMNRDPVDVAVETLHEYGKSIRFYGFNEESIFRLAVSKARVEYMQVGCGDCRSDLFV